MRFVHTHAIGRFKLLCVYNVSTCPTANPKCSCVQAGNVVSEVVMCGCDVRLSSGYPWAYLWPARSPLLSSTSAPWGGRSFSRVLFSTS